MLHIATLFIYYSCCLACDVDIAAPGPIRLSHGRSYTLRCKVTAPDTFDRWDNPAIKIPVKDDPNLVDEQNGDEHDVKITSMNFFLSGVWTCYSKQGKSDNITLLITRKCMNISLVTSNFTSLFR